MKNKVKIIGILVMISLIAICFSTISNAAIEVKPGTAAHVNINPSTAYQYCYDMRSSTSTLGANTLDPHLILNADWGAVTYLGASTYGNIRSANGTEVTIKDEKYYSTTNNITGVMNMGNNLGTFTSSLIDGAAKNVNRTNLEKNINTKYVETLPTECTIDGTKGQALAETAGWYGSLCEYVSYDWPINSRMYHSYFSYRACDRGSQGNGYPSSYVLIAQ